MLGLLRNTFLAAALCCAPGLVHAQELPPAGDPPQKQELPADAGVEPKEPAAQDASKQALAWDTKARNYLGTLTSDDPAVREREPEEWQNLILELNRLPVDSPELNTMLYVLAGLLNNEQAVLPPAREDFYMTTVFLSLAQEQKPAEVMSFLNHLIPEIRSDKWRDAAWLAYFQAAGSLQASGGENHSIGGFDTYLVNYPSLDFIEANRKWIDTARGFMFTKLLDYAQTNPAGALQSAEMWLDGMTETNPAYYSLLNITQSLLQNTGKSLLDVNDVKGDLRRKFDEYTNEYYAKKEAGEKAKGGDNGKPAETEKQDPIVPEDKPTAPALPSPSPPAA